MLNIHVLKCCCVLQCVHTFELKADNESRVHPFRVLHAVESREAGVTSVACLLLHIDSSEDSKSFLSVLEWLTFTTGAHRVCSEVTVEYEVLLIVFMRR